MKPFLLNPDPAPQVYERLWTEALSRFSQGQVELDPHLLNPERDFRRGISLIARPNPAVAEQFTKLINELKALEPEQYFYQPEDFHLTILSLISAATSFECQQPPLDTYHPILAPLFAQTRPFIISFRGVTASAGAVMAQGYADQNRLNELRDTIRQALQPAGLADHLDRRYKISTAHITLMRFQSPPRDLPRLITALTAARSRLFGQTTIARLEFVINDWYMSRDKVQMAATYPLHSES
ncbi:MAG: hypothetical protein L6R45_02195 [Anaerolineae bacterium]|nr:hypothetical protein [Anaerolineae bacterium]